LIEAGIYINGKISASEINITQDFEIEIVYEILVEDKTINYFIAIEFVNGLGIIVFDATSSIYQQGVKGIYKISCVIPGNFLNDGAYFIGLSIKSFGKSIESHFYEGSILSFYIKDPIYNIPTRLHINDTPIYTGKQPGVVRPF
jgi:lipopolysaccharide transport system ATP-binding protein